MANVKNYGLRGVGSDVQMGKAGGRLVYDSGNTLFKFTESDGATLAKIQIADPTGATDAVSKGYLDGVTQGLDIKASVRAASTGNVNLSTDVANGGTLDGVSLATGDRILLKDQSTGSENGIYVVAASGAPARAGDFDDSDSVSGGGFTFVEEGTANADNGYVVTNDGAITVGSTAITFSQFSGAGQITAGAAMTKNGNTLDVAVDDSSIEVSSDALQVKASGITNAMLAGSIDLTSKVTGTLPVANGGTGAATHTSGGVLIGAGAGAVTSNKAAPTGDFVGSSDTQTLTNKTLTSPNISGGTINGNPTIATNDATLTGGSIAGMDVTIGAGKTLDVDGAVDIDASSGNMDALLSVQIRQRLVLLPQQKHQAQQHQRLLTLTVVQSITQLLVVQLLLQLQVLTFVQTRKLLLNHLKHSLMATISHLVILLYLQKVCLSQVVKHLRQTQSQK